tara:strand:+ start:625 stop:912 length:288 start_codon:yes stop_codon:yes gene_type:complete
MFSGFCIYGYAAAGLLLAYAHLNYVIQYLTASNNYRDPEHVQNPMLRVHQITWGILQMLGPDRQLDFFGDSVWADVFHIEDLEVLAGQAHGELMM